MSTQRSSLTARHVDLTQRLIVDAAVDLLESGSVTEVSVRAVARRAGISERTVFRYFASREDLLDALVGEVWGRMRLPPSPQTLTELLAFPKALFDRFEETSALTQATMHSELYHRIRNAAVDGRAAAIRAIIDREAPDRPERERRLAAANINYHVIASTWRYYRVYFGLSHRDTVECARLAIGQALSGLGISLPGEAQS